VLRDYRDPESRSIGAWYPVLELIWWAVFAIVLVALWAYPSGVVIAAMASFAAVLFAWWRIAAYRRARAALNPQRYECASCLRTFAASQLNPGTVANGTYAP
jgi:hypothetical protein